VTVKTAVGDVAAVSPDSSTTKPLRVGMRILYGWKVRTGVESVAELAFESGAIIRIGEQSLVTVSEKLEKTPQPDMDGGH